MARMSRRTQALAFLALAAIPLGQAQLTDVPALSTATTAARTSTTSSSASSSTTSSAVAATTNSAPTSSIAAPAVTVSHLSDLPTIAGAGIPTLVIPYTAAAPFMQKSKLPEGTVFIAVGACLAFLGACVLLWRGLVAWSINRSVKRAATASMRGSEKNGGSTWGGSSGYNPVHGGGGYKDMNGSSMSLDALTSAGTKQPGKPHFRDHEIKRESTPPAGLFFSPTAQAGRDVQSSRNSSYLPAGYYASPSAQTAGGAGATTIGGSLAPYARHSTVGPSPPASPGPPTSRGSASYRATSRDGLRAQSRDGLRAQSRDGLSYGAGSARNSYFDGAQQRQGHSSALYAQPSSSSLMVGIGGTGGQQHYQQQGGESGLPGSRAPSAYLEDLFEEHGSGPRERF
ncbi:hypothetical protein LTR10_009987 [Elasticomyces elasticus]|nr:hypothetical protein LTR10_009987 [Elasticomyces elasticus]KAK4970279.1 hypothetical protein LTR42_008446 [Elasticomyces elasticus]